MSEEQKPSPPSRAAMKPLNKVENLAELFKHPDFKERIASAAPKHFNAERLLRTMVLATQKVPKLLDVSPMQMLGACITLAALGLEPNTPLQHAHLIPFEVTKWNPTTRQREHVRTDVQVIIGYQGYVDLIYRSGLVESVHCDVWYQDEEDSGAFDYEYGSKQHLFHKPSNVARKPNEEPAGAYMHATLKGGGEIFEVMPAVKIHLTRSRSQGFRAAMNAHDDAVSNNRDPMKDKRYSEAPWIKDPESMWRKTVLRLGQKWLPKSIELASALAADERPIDFSKITSGDMVIDGTFAVEDDEPPPAETQRPAPEAQPSRETVAEKPKPSRTAKAPKPAQEPPKPPEEPEALDDGQNGQIVFPMFNQYGEEDDGPFGPAPDPVSFAKDFRQRWNNTMPDDRQALLEANIEAIKGAMEMNPEANVILQTFVIEVAPKPPPPDPKNFPEEKYEISRVKSQAGAWDVVDWTNKAKAMMSGFVSVAQFAAFYEVNEATLKVLPSTAKTILTNYRDDRLQALSGGEPQDDDMPGDEEMPSPAMDEWVELYNQFAEDFQNAKSLGDLSGIPGNPAVKVRLRQLKEARPDLADDLTERYRAREEELRAQL